MVCKRIMELHKCSKFVLVLAVVITFVNSTSQSNSLENTRFEDLRRSGRFQCQEQPEDVERLKRQGTIQCKCKKQLFAPVCGSDGRTYHNHCFLICASKHRYQRFGTENLKLESWGPCPEVANEYDDDNEY